MIDLLKTWSSYSTFNNSPILLVQKRLRKPKIKALLEDIYSLNNVSLTIKIKKNLKYVYIRIK